ncbi:Carboxypeptidase regulatory-like domain protein [anaerobic digester metagenome]|jgi:RNA-splicing ligase RtcB
MVSQLLAGIAVIMVATGAVAGGGLIYQDINEFEIDLTVVDAQTGEPVEGALVEITDANGTLIASGYTDDDGEFELDVEDEDDDEDDEEESDDDGVETEDSDDDDEYSIQEIFWPLTITVTMDGYDVYTTTVELDTMDDLEMEIELEIAA